jgi:COP9 signalosome complex subunit 4
MFNNEIIQRDYNLATFEDSLEEHHKAMMSDGLTIVQRTMIDHNITAISILYANIYFSDLAIKIGVSAEAAEQVAAKMISNGTLLGSIDQVEGLLKFDYEQSPDMIRNDAIMNFCVNLNRVTEKVQRVLSAQTTGGKL